METVKTLFTWLVALAGEDVGRPGHTPATSSSAADQDIDIVNTSSGNPDHGHSSCAGGACQFPLPIASMSWTGYHTKGSCTLLEDSSMELCRAQDDRCGDLR